MHRAIRVLAWCGTALLGVMLTGVIAYDSLVAAPRLAWVEQTLHGATASERQPPLVLIDMLHRANGDRLNGLLARRALSSGEIGRYGRLIQLASELGLALLLPAHFSDQEIEAAYLASAFMGLDAPGFEAASLKYLGVPLARVDAAQAARLVAIAWAPSAYLGNPERVEQRAQRLLALPPSQPGRLE